MKQYVTGKRIREDERMFKRYESSHKSYQRDKEINGLIVQVKDFKFIIFLN